MNAQQARTRNASAGSVFPSVFSADGRDDSRRKQQPNKQKGNQ